MKISYIISFGIANILIQEVYPHFAVSEATGTPIMKKKFESFNIDTFKTDQQKKEEVS